MDEKYLNEFGGNLNWIKGVIPMACPFEFDPTKEFLYRDLFPNEKDINTLMPMGIEIKNKLPPFFIMHGKFDPILPENQVFEFLLCSVQLPDGIFYCSDYVYIDEHDGFQP